MQLSAINLSGYQKILLAMIVNAPESPQGGKRIHLNNEKLVTAQQILRKLGLIKVDPETELLSLTDQAMIKMQEEGIVDEAGMLTNIGKQYAAGKIPGVDQNKNVAEQQEKFHISFKSYLLLFE